MSEYTELFMQEVAPSERARLCRKLSEILEREEMEQEQKAGMLIACSKCCTRLHKVGENCMRCKRGVGEQVWPIVRAGKAEEKTCKKKAAFYSNITRPKKHTPPVEAEKLIDIKMQRSVKR